MDKVVHFEIPFENKPRAMKFYTQCFGWQLQDMPDMQYVMARTVAVNDQQMPTEPGAINGGLFQRPKEAPSPVIDVGVTSVAKALENVQALPPVSWHESCRKWRSRLRSASPRACRRRCRSAA